MSYCKRSLKYIFSIRQLHRTLISCMVIIGDGVRYFESIEPNRGSAFYIRARRLMRDGKRHEDGKYAADI